MKYIVAIFVLFFSLSVFGGKNVEITAKYVKDNKNYIYMESKKERFKIKKKGLTKEGVKQILANKEASLTLFIPEDSIVDQSPKPEK